MGAMCRELHEKDRIFGPKSCPAGLIDLVDQKLANAAQETAIGDAALEVLDLTEDSVVELFLSHTRKQALLFLGPV